MKDLIKYYNQAISKVPFLKYSRVVIVTAFILAIIAYLKLNNKDVFFYAFIVLFLTFLTFLLAQLTRSKEKVIKVAFYTVVYCVVATICTGLLSFASFIVMGKPDFYQRWFPQKNLYQDTTAKTKEIHSLNNGIINGFPDSSDIKTNSKFKNSPAHSSNKTEIRKQQIEISIQLTEKSEGYSFVFINNKEVFPLPQSTRFNPRIKIENDNINKQVLIVTKNGDSCLAFLPNNFDSSFFRLVPNCK